MSAKFANIAGDEVLFSMSPRLPQIKVQTNPLATKMTKASHSPTANPMKESLFFFGL